MNFFNYFRFIFHLKNIQSMCFILCADVSSDAASNNMQFYDY